MHNASGITIVSGNQCSKEHMWRQHYPYVLRLQTKESLVLD